MALEVARACRERILARAHRGCGGFGFREIVIRVERPQLQPAAIDVPHAIDREEDVGPHRIRRMPRVGLEPRHEIVQPLARRDRERGAAERARAVRDVDVQLIRAVRHALQIELEQRRRFAQVARHAVDRAEIFHDLGRALCTLCTLCPLPQRRVRGQRAIELNRRRVDLFQPDLVEPRRVDDDAIAADDERVGEVRRVGPLPAGQQRRALRVEAAELTDVPEPRRFGDLPIDLVNLRLELSLRPDRRLLRAVAHAHRREARERLGSGSRRQQQRNGGQDDEAFHGGLLELGEPPDDGDMVAGVRAGG